MIGHGDPVPEIELFFTDPCVEAIIEPLEFSDENGQQISNLILDTE